MTIEEINRFVKSISGKFSLGTFTDNQFNDAARRSQIDAIKARYERYQGKVATQADLSELATVSKSATVVSTTVSGEAVLNLSAITDYMLFDNLSYERVKSITRITPTTVCNVPVTNTTTTTNVVTDIYVIERNELAYKISDLVAPATLEYPVAAWASASSFILAPLAMSGKTIKVNYYAEPVAPSITTSVDFTLPESSQTELIARIIRYLSTSNRDVTLAQLMQQIQ
jgi:hypothetical protein